MKKNTCKCILVPCIIKFLCPTLNNLQMYRSTDSTGTVTHTESRSVHTFASMAYVTVSVDHPPISGSAVDNDGMQTVSFTTPDAKIKRSVVRGMGRPSNWAANLSQTISVKNCDPDIPPEPRRRYILWVYMSLTAFSFKLGMRNSSNMYRYTTPVKRAISQKSKLETAPCGHLQSLQADY
jgi:hypothetical protein